MYVLSRATSTSPAEAALGDVVREYGPGRQRLAGLALVGSGFRGLEQHSVISGIIFTAQGLAVVGVQQVVGQSGYLFAPAHGAWTVGGQMVKLAGGGSNPSAATDAAVKSLVTNLRRGGIDPGYVQSLIAVTGELSGVAQPETERGSGVVVSKLDPDLFAEAIGQATAQTAGGLAHLWTTADVVAALKILGLGRVAPATEALTNELFPYSPYVLRPTSLDDLAYPGDGDLEESPRVVVPAPPREDRDTGTVPGLALLPGSAAASGALPPPPPPSRDRSAIFDGDGIDGDEVRPARRLKWLAAAAVLVLIAVGIYVGAGWMLDDNTADSGSEGSPSAVVTTEPVVASTTAEPQPPQTLGEFVFAPGPVNTVKDCAATSYGQAQEFFASTNCVSLKRGLFLTEADGRKIAVSVAEITMPDAASAAALRKLLDSNGTGNVDTLLVDGEQPEGYPDSTVLKGANYASAVNGQVVRIVESAWVDGPDSTEGDAADTAADVALQATMP